MALLLRGMNIDFEKEFCFHPVRKWRFDFAIPEKKIAVEIEGGTWKKSRHGYGKGFENDCIKYNEASILGWKLLRFTTGQVEKNPKMVSEFILKAIENVNNSSM